MIPQQEKDATERYAYAIRTKKLLRPMDNITHVAKLTRMVDRKLGIDIPSIELGEGWGESASEAQDKLEERIKAWILAKES